MIVIVVVSNWLYTLIQNVYHMLLKITINIVNA
jgi:hypothetical protein